LNVRNVEEAFVKGEQIWDADDGSNMLICKNYVAIADVVDDAAEVESLPKALVFKRCN
jgi:hypothetical protein